ncbi:MAG: hypothetical protein QW214_05585 [Saccharolobus sp.]
MLSRLRKIFIISFVISIILGISIPLTFSQAPASENNIIIAPSIPGGVLPFAIPTTGSSASFTFYVINENPTTETVTVYLNGNQYTTLDLPAYSYKPVTLSLPIGQNVINVGSQSLTVNVAKVPTIVNGEALLNGSVGSILINAQAGHNYVVNLTITKITNWNTSSEEVTYSSDVYTNMYNGLYPITPSLQIPIQNSSLILIKIPPYIPQGLYYFFNYIYFYNFSNYQQVLGYIPYIIFVNVSYGLNGSIVTTNTYTSNGITVSFTTQNGYTYILSKYPFSTNDKVILHVIPTSSSQVFTSVLDNYTTVLYLSQVQYTLSYYGSNATEFAYTNSWVEFKIPQQFTTSQYQINITYVTPTGIVSTGLLPVITSTTSTSTTTTTTSSTTTTSTSSTSSTTTTTTSTSTTSTTTTSSTSSTTTTSTISTSSSTTTTTTTSTTTSTSSTTSTSTTSTTTTTTSTTTTSLTTTTTTTTSPFISTTVAIIIAIIIVVIVVIAIVLLRRS